MDVGLAPWSSDHEGFDRARYPVKYYLSALDGLRFVDDDQASAEYERDVVNLGKLVQELFGSVRHFPLFYHS